MPKHVTPSLGPLHAVGVLQTHEGDVVVVDGGRMVDEECELIRHGVLSGASPAQYDAGSRQKSTGLSWSGPKETFAVGSWPQTPLLSPEAAQGPWGAILYSPPGGLGKKQPCSSTLTLPLYPMGMGDPWVQPCLQPLLTAGSQARPFYLLDLSFHICKARGLTRWPWVYLWL